MKFRFAIFMLQLVLLILLPPGSWSILEAQQSAAPGLFDVLIRNGKILDGTGNPWYHADLGIRGDRIVAIGKLSGATAKKTIDAAGKIVAPGFIDTLGQSELALL